MQSKYALKVQGKVNPVSNTRKRRVCDGCGRSLAGSRGHGFPSRDGRRIFGGCCVVGVSSITNKQAPPHINSLKKVASRYQEDLAYA